MRSEMKKEMGQITGTGSPAFSGMLTAFLCANPDHILDAAAAAVCVMGTAGEYGLGKYASGRWKCNLSQPGSLMRYVI